MRRIDFFMSARASTPATQGHHHDDNGPKTRRILRIFVRTDATHRPHTAIPIRPNCFVPEHYKRAANNLLISEGVCWMAHAEPLYPNRPNSYSRNMRRSRGRTAINFAERTTTTRAFS